MADHMVMMTSVLAATVLFCVFFTGLALAPSSRNGRVIGAFLSAVLAGVGWSFVVTLARSRGWVQTEEAQFHHLYILGSVGLPLVGAIILIASFMRPANDRRARHAGRAIAALFLLPAAIGFYATNIEPQWLRVDHHTVAGPHQSTVRVGVIADIQTDGFGQYEADAIAQLLAEEPDVVLVAGDLTQVPPSAYSGLVEDAAETLSELTAPHGVFVISGNTDPDVASVVELADSAGLTALDDAIAEFEVDGTLVRVLGVSWPNNRRAAASELLRSFAAEATEESVDIVLAHSPDVVFNFSEVGAIDLVVAGHTHGGQIQVPLYGPVWNVTELPRDVAGGGLHEVRGVPLYVSTGVGVQRGESPKVRFGVRPSVGVLEVGVK